MASLPSGSLPATLTDLTPDWLTAALKESGALSVGTVTHLDVNVGAKWHIAETAIVSVTYFDDAEFVLPGRYFVKLARFDDPLEPVLPGENAFYRQWEAAELPIPRCYGAFFDKKTCLSCLILQDLSETHRATPWPEQLDQPDCETAIRALASIHGYFWYKPNETDEPGIDRLIENETILARDFQSVLPGFFDAMGSELSIEKRKLIETAFARFPELKSERLKDGRPATIVHGDPHAWNVMFPKERTSPPSCVFIDWEDWRYDAGAADLAYMMALNRNPNWRARYEQDLLALYHDALMATTDTDYSRDDLMLDYRIGLLQHVVVPVYLQQFRPEDTIWRDHLERWFAAIDDLDCMALI